MWVRTKHDCQPSLALYLTEGSGDVRVFFPYDENGISLEKLRRDPAYSMVVAHELSEQVDEVNFKLAVVDAYRDSIAPAALERHFASLFDIDQPFGERGLHVPLLRDTLRDPEAGPEQAESRLIEMLVDFVESLDYGHSPISASQLGILELSLSLVRYRSATFDLFRTRWRMTALACGDRYSYGGETVTSKDVFGRGLVSTGIFPQLRDNVWCYRLGPTVHALRFSLGPSGGPFSADVSECLPEPRFEKTLDLLSRCPFGYLCGPQTAERPERIALTLDHALLSASTILHLDPKTEKRVEGFLQKVASREAFLLRSGLICREGVWQVMEVRDAKRAADLPFEDIPEGEIFDTLDNLTAVAFVETASLDLVFGRAGSGLKVWSALRSSRGLFDSDRLIGFRKTSEGECGSRAYGLWGLFAAKTLHNYYKDSLDTSDLRRDMRTLEEHVYARRQDDWTVEEAALHLLYSYPLAGIRDGRGHDSLL